MLVPVPQPRSRFWSLMPGVLPCSLSLGPCRSLILVPGMLSCSASRYPLALWPLASWPLALWHPGLSSPVSSISPFHLSPSGFSLSRVCALSSAVHPPTSFPRAPCYALDAFRSASWLFVRLEARPSGFIRPGRTSSHCPSDCIICSVMAAIPRLSSWPRCLGACFYWSPHWSPACSPRCSLRLVCRVDRTDPSPVCSSPGSCLALGAPRSCSDQPASACSRTRRYSRGSRPAPRGAGPRPVPHPVQRLLGGARVRSALTYPVPGAPPGLCLYSRGCSRFLGGAAMAARRRLGIAQRPALLSRVGRRTLHAGG